MAGKVTVRIEGLRELGERMRTLERKMALKVCRRATGKAANVIKRKAISKLETNPSVDTRLLEKNVIVKRNTRTRLTSEHDLGVRIAVYPGKVGKRKRDTGMVGRFLEFGTVKMAPEPWMRPAFDEGKSDALDVMIETIDDGLKDAGR